jgi:UDPglucose--hexose-1-phosphate uridylyltransferase
MEKLVLQKPDGRRQILYSRRPISPNIEALSPEKNPVPKSGHLRFNPMRNEWIIYAGHRQNRTFLPPANYNPLAPTESKEHPTELPQGNYDVSVFENLFSSLGSVQRDAGPLIVPTDSAKGTCEVVVYTQNPNTSFGELPLKQIELVIEVWADRTRDLGAREDVKYIFMFENRGVEVGATLHHPHGQIYAYPFVPPIPAQELKSQRDYWEKKGSGMLEDHIRLEQKDKIRILYEGEHAIAFVPVFARYAYEVWLAPKRAAPTFADLKPVEIADLARAMKTVLLKYDRLWSRPFPYVMVWHQAPTDGQPHPEAHLHAEFYPPYRMPGRLKYLAGSEIGAGVFTADTLPEERANELRNVQITLE